MFEVKYMLTKRATKESCFIFLFSQILAPETNHGSIGGMDSYKRGILNSHLGIKRKILV